MKKLIHSQIALNRLSLDTLNLAQKFPLYILLDNIRSSYNVGSIFRTSDAIMIEKLFLTGYTPAPPKKEILKTALGATESVNWEYHKDAIALIKSLKAQGIKISALEITDESIEYSKVSREHFPLCLVVGNEITGIQNSILEECDFALEIPMFGIKHSLNVAVAYGIAVYELRKKYFS
ncbi:MAG: RNA methyltransferase [Ignavibacteria bacterium]|nr:RNA methyltransferase [Ignavibacteria bacterium]